MTTDDFAGLAEITMLTSFAEVHEVFLSSSFTIPTAHEDVAPFRRGTLVTLNGPAHKARRRLMTPLFNARNLRYIQESVTPEAVRAELERFGGGPGLANQRVNLDLVQFSEAIFLRIIGKMIGLHNFDSHERLARLQELLGPLNLARLLDWPPDHYASDRSKLVREAGAAKDAFFAEFVEPTVRHYERTRSAGDEAAPTGIVDLIGVLVRNSFDDDAIARECCLFITAGTVNNTSKLVYCVEDLERWCSKHPSDGELLTDRVFLKRAADETLRLRGASQPYFRRRASETVTLKSSGRVILEGSLVGLDLVAADRDPAFGEATEVFNPHRADAAGFAQRPYGLAFGAGAHQCLGLPMVSGASLESGMTGVMSEVLYALYRREIQVLSDGKSELLQAIPPRYMRFPVSMATNESG